MRDRIILRGDALSGSIWIDPIILPDKITYFIYYVYIFFKIFEFFFITRARSNFDCT
jgi:hypothetical protein